MSINNYGDLKAALSGYMFQSRFVPQYDNATTLFEAAANRRLRVRQMEASTPLATVDGDAALPPDYLNWRTVLDPAVSPALELDYVHPAYLDSTSIGTSNSNPQIFTIENGLFRERPIRDGDFEFHYYRKIPTITASPTAANWLIAEYPDSYLFGVLTELFALGRNREGAELYKARRDETFAEIIQLSALTTGATSPAVRTGEYY